MTNPTPAAAPAPARWLTELMANPLSALQSFGSDRTAILLARLPMLMFTPPEATNAFVQWQQQAFQQMVRDVHLVERADESDFQSVPPMQQRSIS